MSDVISWWENELTSNERSLLLIKSWSDIGENNPKGIKKRHGEMKKIFELWTKTQMLERKYGNSEWKTDVVGSMPWNLWQPIRFKDGKTRRITHIECRNMAVDLIRFDVDK
ncbi:hypothetical protein LCGC14_1201560, partial [marine sediment metagenome]